MANLKSITELPVVESSENLNLIVNDNGAAKQIPASAVGAQADWSQNDETSPDYVKNRPFYSEFTYETGFVPRDTVFETGEFCTDAGDNLGRSYSFNKNFLVEGTVYTINWDGSEYSNITCHKNDSGLLYIGSDPSVGADYSTLPFMMYADSPAATYVNVRVDSSYSDYISQLVVRECVETDIVNETVHKIDPKYLPNASRGVHIIDTTTYTWGDAAKEALLRGDTVYINEGTTGYTLVTGFDIWTDASGNNFIKVVSPVRSYGSGFFVTELRQFSTSVTSVEVN